METPALSQALRAADVLVRGFSAGRRLQCRPVLGEGRDLATDLRRVYLPWPIPAPLTGRALTAALALQCAPSKEAVADLALHALDVREQKALQWVEGAAACAWISRRWPGLTDVLRTLVPESALVPHDPDDGAAMLERAVALARTRKPLAIPAVFGQLPLSRSALLDLRARRRQLEARLPWSSEQRLRRLSRWSVAVAGNGGDVAAPRAGTPDLHEEERMLTHRRARAGIPYPEWNGLAQRYREDHVVVIETRLAPTRSSAPTIDPKLASWFEQPVDRCWRHGLEDGSDVDLDALVDARVDELAGLRHRERVYRERLPGTRDVCCALLLDRSNSLVQAGNLKLELACARALGAAMDRAGERYGVFSFWSDTRHHVAVEVLRDFDDTRGLTLADEALRPRGYTRIGAAVRHLSARLRQQASGRRVLMVLGDAIPCDEGYEGEYAVADVVKAVEEAEQFGVTVAFIAVGSPPEDPLSEPLRKRLTRVASPEDLAPVLAELHARLAA